MKGVIEGQALEVRSLLAMMDAHRQLADKVPPPQLVWVIDGYAYRYVEKTVGQALIQKLSRLVTGLKAADLLLKNGFHQEQAAIQRVIDEMQEDIAFLAYPEITGIKTLDHDKYLQAFYQEEFDAPTAITSTQKRNGLQRKVIRSYLAKIEGPGVDAKFYSEVSRTLYSVYSGYVHAASPQVMELYDGASASWRLGGFRDSVFARDHQNDIWNQYYRSLMSFTFVAKVLGDDELFRKMYLFAVEFEKSKNQG